MPHTSICWLSLTSVCSGCVVLWLVLRVVGGIGLAGGLSVDWNAFCLL